MIADLVLANAKAYYNKQLIDCAVAIDNGEIIKIGKETQMPKADAREDLRSLLLLPGVIDAHTHLRDEGKAYKEDFSSGTAAAAAGGVTTVLDMPNNDPVTNSVVSLQNRMKIAKPKVYVNVAFYSEFPESPNQIEEIGAKGAIGFKLFMASQIGGLDPDDDKSLHEAFRKVAAIGLPIAVHAEDKATTEANTRFLKREKREDPRAFLQAHPIQSELKAVNHALDLAAKSNALLHVCHVTARECLDKILEAKQSGRKVTCEVTPHHLLLSQMDFERRGPLLAVLPPLRSSKDVAALQESVSTGKIDTVGSDHAPHTANEKSARSIWDVKVGFPGLETTLPLLLTLVAKRQLSLEILVALLSERPAEIFHLKRRGRLEKGYVADLVALDYKQKTKIDASKFHSKAKFSPFDGMEVQGKPVKTFVNGLLIMDDQEIVVKPGSGTIIRS